MAKNVWTTAGYVCSFVPSTSGLYSDTKNDSASSWWKLAIGLIAGSGVTYLIMKSCMKSDKDYSYLISTLNTDFSPSPQKDARQSENKEEENVSAPVIEEVAMKAETTPNATYKNENKDLKDASSTRSANERIRKAQLPYPDLFCSVPDELKAKVIQELAKKLQNHYLQYPSLNYFYYVFGGKGLPRDYVPNTEDRIDFIGTVSQLRCLMICLYRPAGKSRLNRGTWTIVEECFLLQGRPIRRGYLKEQTNKIPIKVKTEMTEILSKVYTPTSNDGKQVQSGNLP